MNKWHCANCGYRYDGGKPPDICPEYGATLRDFHPRDDILLNVYKIR
jgi:rubredoxin